MAPEKAVRQISIHPDAVGNPADYWRASSRGYLRHIEGETGGDGRTIRDTILHPRVLDHLGDVVGKSVLDIGGGDGILSRELVRRGARVFNGEQAMDLAKYSVNGTPVIQSIQLSAIEAMPFPKNYFDTAVSNLVMMWLPDIKKLAVETYRILKPGGRFVASITHPMVNLGTFDLSEPNRPSLKIQAPLNRGVWLKMINETNGPYPYYQRSPGEYVNTFTGAGFRLVPGKGYEDVFFSDEFVENNPIYLKHQWYPLFLLFSFEK